MYNKIPAELQALPQWVLWRYVTDSEGRKTKVPFSVTGKAASSTDPSTWTTFQQAVNASQYFEGIGFVLSKNDPYAIIDLDNKPEKPCTPEQAERHTKIYNAFQSYTELSTSGTGVHIVVRGALPSGVKRDNVEVYSDSRFMIFTGNVTRDLPIQDYQELLDILYGEMQPQTKAELTEHEEQLSDEDIMDMAMRALNADKFNALCNGNMEEYPSQSEADFALLSIFAFYTKSNEQVRRLFRMSALGKRDKAVKNNTYLDFALSKIRGNEPPPIDFSQLEANALAVVQQVETPDMVNPISLQTDLEPINKSITLPPGIIGELAEYFYQTAIRPVPEIALCAAISLVAGVVGRSYNISNSGLNQYMILLAKTGSGKEGALMGIENLLTAVRPTIPMVDEFIGPAAFASGQALIKVLNDQPCFVSVLGEFGLTLQQLSDHRANSAQIMLRRVLLDLYAKSGFNRMLRASVYADTEKNTQIVQAPNVTILGESTPETFYDGLDASHIAEGLIPRFMVIEYDGDRPVRNRKANIEPPPALAQRFTDLVAISLTTANNHACCQVRMDSHSLELMDDFDTRADAIMNESKLDVEVQLWNRAHLKALKLAALIAVGVNPHDPVINKEVAQWAINLVKRDITGVASRFKEGDVGQGDSKQFHDLKRAIEGFLRMSPDQLKKAKESTTMHKDGVIPYRFLVRKTAAVASFRKDKIGSTNALKRTLQNMVDSGMLIEIARPTLHEKYAFQGVAYGVTANWS